MKDDNCIFCKIAEGQIPSNTLYEDEYFRVILDIAPAAKGHAIVLPKSHSADLLSVDALTAERALPVISRVAAAIKKAQNCDGINILQNNGTAAGQSVFHLHFHIIPRYENDQFVIPWKTLSYADGEAAELAAKVRAELSDK